MVQNLYLKKKLKPGLPFLNLGINTEIFQTISKKHNK